MSLTVVPPHSFLTIGMADIDLFPAVSECTVSQAATILGVSEGYVDEVLRDGLIAFRWDNGERLIERNILLDYREERRRMNAALDEMIRWDQEIGLYDD